MRIGILTVSDLGAIGQRADTSGDAILDWAGARGYEVAVRSVVPDETDRIAGKLARWADSGEVDVILTTGGTGLTARDVTPEATEAVVERLAPRDGQAPRPPGGPPVPPARRPPRAARRVGVGVGGGVREPGAAQLLPRGGARWVAPPGRVGERGPAGRGRPRRLGLPGSLEKPADPAEVAATVRRLIERRKLQQRTGIIGESPAIQEVLVKIEQMAPASSTVLVDGASGTGKALLAPAIQHLPPRHSQPYYA